MAAPVEMLSRLLWIRDAAALPDKALAGQLGLELKDLTALVAAHPDRFPETLVFHLTAEERQADVADLICCVLERTHPSVRLTGFHAALLEVAAGVLSAVGCVLIICLKDSTVALYGAILSAVAITALFFGQRVAKDYAGAAVLVPYFLLALVAIYLLAQP